MGLSPDQYDAAVRECIADARRKGIDPVRALLRDGLLTPEEAAGTDGKSTTVDP